MTKFLISPWHGRWLLPLAFTAFLPLCATAADVTRSFANTTPLAIADSGTAQPYPSTISVTGMAGTITKISVSIRGLTHTFPDDLDILLVAPDGKKLLIMSDAGGSFPVSGIDLTFMDGAPAIPNASQLASATYSPGNYGLGPDTFPAPGPAGPYVVALTNVTGIDPNGNWALYVVDDALESVGSIDGGWSLSVTAFEPSPTLSIAQVGSNVVIKWPVSAPGYVLEGTTRLDASSAWTPVTNPVSVMDDQNQVTVPIESIAQFFRLKR